jgi:hypothetical protein
MQALVPAVSNPSSSIHRARQNYRSVRAPRTRQPLDILVNTITCGVWVRFRQVEGISEAFWGRGGIGTTFSRHSFFFDQRMIYEINGLQVFDVNTLLVTGLIFFSTFLLVIDTIPYYLVAKRRRRKCKNMATHVRCTTGWLGLGLAVQ